MARLVRLLLIFFSAALLVSYAPELRGRLSLVASPGSRALLGSSLQSHQARSEFGAILEQIHSDFLPYKHLNISLEMIESTYCHSKQGGWRLQVVDGQMYAVGETLPFQSRHHSVKAQLLELARTGGRLPDVDIYFASEDLPEVPRLTGSEACRMLGPQLQQTKQASHQHIILHPCPTFGGWPEAYMGPWAELQQMMSLEAEKHPWETRVPAVLFAGAILGRQQEILAEALAADAGAHPELDVRWRTWDQPQSLMDIHEFCKWRGLLNLEGQSWSSRLKYLLLCGSTIVMADSPWLEFWYRALRPGVNYMPVAAVTQENKGRPLIEAAQWLVQNATAAHRMAKAAQVTGLHTLSPANIQSYWRHLLATYARLQTFQTTVHPDAVPLHLSLQHPVIITSKQRTCHVCPR